MQFKRIVFLVLIAGLSAIVGFGSAYALFADRPIDFELVTVMQTQTATADLEQAVLIPLDTGDYQAFVDQHPAGTHFIFADGRHRGVTITPRDGDTFSGQGNVILSGAILLDTIEPTDSGLWAVRDMTHGFERDQNDVCMDGFPRCNHGSDLFIGDQPLLHVAQLSDVSAGRWFFDYDADTLYFADNPAGKIIETSVLDVAFDGDAQGVTIENLTIEKYANLALHGAIHGDETRDWRLDRVTVRLNHGAGVRIGHGMHITNSLIYSNGQIGVAGIGDDVLIENNEIAFNNYAGYGASWEAGGTKFVRTNNLTVRGNRVHHNNGPGLWTDIDNINTTISNNDVFYNTGAGIFHEISYAARIDNNRVQYNGVGNSPWLFGAQIMLSTSSDVSVTNNVLVVSHAGGNGIGIIQQDRGEGDHGVRRSYNNTVTDNTVVYMGAQGVTGIATDTDQERFWDEANNQFDRNTYHVNQPDGFHWETNGQPMNWETFVDSGYENDGQRIINQRPTGIAELPAVDLAQVIQQPLINTFSTTAMQGDNSQ